MSQEYTSDVIKTLKENGNTASFAGKRIIVKNIAEDYEYASFNPVAYDIANQLCEMVANYHSAKPRILDYNKYPAGRY
ncbi:probable choline kinase 1 isoform X2 [Phragmites australis]|uniref:probable choline kinase 1 isoform X2 n=1 Tax=Phragmites australis TaxID=29695 RepID=UPI002D776082|nr:probable choline kinase 1 isoform X2 [Phragmites australis]